MSLINCHVKLSLTWDSNSVLCTLAGASTFKITTLKLTEAIFMVSRLIIKEQTI